MKIPDKIYIRPQTNPNMLGGLWSGKPTKETTATYIRKDALTEWAENWKKLGMSDDFLYAMELLINHMNSM